MTQEFDSVLVRLADGSRPVRSINISPLSDLARERLSDFEATWHALSASRRLELIREMVEQAETNIHFNFHAILRTLLHDPEPEVRKLAVEGLWEDEKTNLISPLAGLLLDDPAVEVRAAAAISLGRYILLGVLGDIREEPALSAERALLQAWSRIGEVHDVRRRALESLAYGSTSDLNEMIRNAYYDEDAALRQSAVFAMGRTADARWSRLVLEELHSYEPAMRFEAAQAAGEMGLKAAVQPLIKCVDDPDANVRQASVAALGRIGGPAVKRALQALRHLEDEALVQAAEDALDELNFGSDTAADPIGTVPNTLLDFAIGSSVKEAISDDLDDLDDLKDLDHDWESSLGDDVHDEDDFGFEDGLEVGNDDDLDWDDADGDEYADVGDDEDEF